MFLASSKDYEPRPVTFIFLSRPYEVSVQVEQEAYQFSLYVDYHTKKNVFFPNNSSNLTARAD
jgi:hypothetical protein